MVGTRQPHALDGARVESGIPADHLAAALTQVVSGRGPTSEELWDMRAVTASMAIMLLVGCPEVAAGDRERGCAEMDEPDVEGFKALDPRAMCPECRRFWLAANLEMELGEAVGAYARP